MFLEDIKCICIFHHFSTLTETQNPCILYISTMAADVLATQGAAKESAAMIWTQSFRNIRISASEVCLSKTEGSRI